MAVAELHINHPSSLLIDDVLKTMPTSPRFAELAFNAHAIPGMRERGLDQEEAYVDECLVSGVVPFHLRAMFFDPNQQRYLLDPSSGFQVWRVPPTRKAEVEAIAPSGLIHERAYNTGHEAPMEGYRQFIADIWPQLREARYSLWRGQIWLLDRRDPHAFRLEDGPEPLSSLHFDRDHTGLTLKLRQRQYADTGVHNIDQEMAEDWFRSVASEYHHKAREPRLVTVR